jgi:hypothetical protein
VIRKPPPGQSLAELMPQLAAEWHPTLNGDLTPADVLPGSNAPVWWRCSNCQREWGARVFKRAKAGRGCRECGIARRTAARATPKPGQSFADLHPEAAAEWHPTLNDDLKPTDVKPGSRKSPLMTGYAAKSVPCAVSVRDTSRNRLPNLAVRSQTCFPTLPPNGTRH